jgi:hypothetical protein
MDKIQKLLSVVHHRQNPLVSTSSVLYLGSHFPLQMSEELDLYAALLLSQSACQIAVDLLDSLLLTISRYWLQGHELPILCMRNDAYEFEVCNFVLFGAQAATCRILFLAAGSTVIVTCIHALESKSCIPISVRASHGSGCGMWRRVPFPIFTFWHILYFSILLHSFNTEYLFFCPSM